MDTAWGDPENLKRARRYTLTSQYATGQKAEKSAFSRSRAGFSDSYAYKAKNPPRTSSAVLEGFSG
jgi:hypothetical protein